MDDKLRSEVMEAIAELQAVPFPGIQKTGCKLMELLGRHEHLEIQMLQARNIIAAATDGLENWKHHCPFDDTAFAILSHAKAFLEENP